MTTRTTTSSPPGAVLQTLSLGTIAAVMGFASTVVLVLQGYQAVGATADQAATALLALCVVKGALGLWLSWQSRMPVMTAWSTPGAALLIFTGTPPGGWAESVGAFLVAAGLIVIAGMFRPVARAVSAIPGSVAAAMLAGILFELCLAPVRAVEAEPLLAAPIVLTWVVMLRLAPLFAVPLAAAVTAVVVGVTVDLPAETLAWRLPSMTPVVPVFSLDGAISLALPLFVVTMASQNIPGLAVLRANGYEVAPGRVFVATGAASGVIGVFGGHSINLAAITAALCAGPEAHRDPSERWRAAVTAGVCYIVLGLTASMVMAFVVVAPPLLIQAVAGLALLSSLGGALASGLAEEETRLPAVVTFVIAASGVSFFGVGAAFWALIAGVILLWALSAGPAPDGVE